MPYSMMNRAGEIGTRFQVVRRIATARLRPIDRDKRRCRLQSAWVRFQISGQEKHVNGDIVWNRLCLPVADYRITGFISQNPCKDL